MNTDEAIIELSKQSGKTEEEIKELIQKKIAKFEGLITEEGALHMVEKELGVKRNYKSVNIGEIEEGMRGISINARVQSVFPEKVFEKGNKKGKLQSAIISDDTGEIRLTLWNEQIDKYALEKNDKIIIENAIVSSYNEKKQVTLGFNGTIKIEKRETIFKELSDLKENENSVNVIVKLLRKFPAKEFSNENKAGKYINFQVGDKSAILRATAWNEKVEIINGFEEGQVLEIRNAYTKEGQKGIELHLGYSAIIRQSEKEIQSIKEMKEDYQEKKINEITPGENVKLIGKIIEIMRGNLHYLVCSKCGKKITKFEGGMYCEQCGETKTGINPIISITIEDGTGRIRANFFGKQALELIGMNKEELEKELKLKTAEMIIAELKEKLIGKEISIIGYSKENSFSGENEVNVKEILQ